MKKILIFRFGMMAPPNLDFARVLQPFYDPTMANVFFTPMGVLSVMMSPNTADEIFTALKARNWPFAYVVIEVDGQDHPIKTFHSVDGVSNTVTGLTQEQMDANKSPEQLDAELNALLDKITTGGREGLTADELTRLEHLSSQTTQ